MVKQLFILIISASGAGKTHFTQILKQQSNSKYCHVAYFDRISDIHHAIEKIMHTIETRMAP